ncbi:MAG TPA: choice-of-anchor V domain-containing protein [Blastocatellia bacterium]|nr:choice-of-anchor V domain-containing protein [Blastocatellia bacterium]
MNRILSLKALKIAIIGVVVAVSLTCLLNGRKASAYQEGPPASHTGAPSELTCNTSGCHTSFTTNSGPGTLNLSGLPAGGYVGGQDYTLTVTLNQASRALFGFELTALDASGKKAGNLAQGNDGRTQVINGQVGNNLRQYIEHSLSGSDPVSGNGSWTFKWTAPATSTGKVTFYFAGNAADGQNGSFGDYIYTKSVSVDPQAAVPITTVSAANYKPSTPTTAESIVAGFGQNMASGVFVADTNPLPTTLGGTTVRVKDSQNVSRDSPLFFVAPNQINYMVPQGTATGAATVTVLSGSTTVTTGTLNVATTQPALFSADASGGGPGAGYLLRFPQGGGNTTEQIAQNPGSGWVTIPISLGPDSDQLFLILFGSGIRNRAQLSDVTCTIGGVPATVAFAGPQGFFAGLDQLNIIVPHTVTKDTDLDVIVSISGTASNAVKVRFKQ